VFLSLLCLSFFSFFWSHGCSLASHATCPTAKTTGIRSRPAYLTISEGSSNGPPGLAEARRLLPVCVLGQGGILLAPILDQTLQGKEALEGRPLLFGGSPGRNGRRGGLPDPVC